MRGVPMSDMDAKLLFRAAGPLAPLHGWASWTMRLAGWRRFGFAMLMGALAAGALPPVDLTPLLLISFTALVWLADARSARGDAFLLGWSFGFGFFVAGLYWIGAALLVDIDSFWWLMPFAVLGIPAGLAIFTGVAVLLAGEANRRFQLRGSARILTLAMAWVVMEWLRGHILTGFPWNLVGYAWSGAFPGSDAMLQTTAIVGIYSLSLITVTAAALPARLADFDRDRHWAIVAAVALVGIPLLGGAARLMTATNASVPGITIRLVQPSIPQTLKSDPNAQVDNFRRLMALSTNSGGTPISAVVWPEAAAPPFLERNEELRRDMAAAMPGGALLLLGDERTDAPPARPEHVWNGLVALAANGDVIGAYNKFHLVPFGEYVPLRSVLPIKKITPGTLDFSAGLGPHTLELPGLPAADPLICYEIIFPGEVIDEAHRPGWFLNITNDAWYGLTSGPFQHFAIARVRAVEEGLPLMRAANNGISAAVDPYGRVLSRLGLDEIGALDVKLPQALPVTIYGQFKDISLVLLLLFDAILVGCIAWRHRRINQTS